MIGVVTIESICLSYKYRLPNKVFEYLQAGLPVIVSDMPEMSAIVRKYKVGEIVPEDDPKALASGLNQLLSSPEKLSYHRERVLAAVKELNWNEEQLKLLNVYDRLVGLKKLRSQASL